MRYLPTLLLLVLTGSAAQGQTPPAPAEVRQALREALSAQVPVPTALPRLPQSLNEPARAAAPKEARASSPPTRLSREVIERAGRLAPQLPTSVPREPTRMGAAAADATADTQAAASRARAEEIRRQLPPRPGTPGSPRGTPPSPPPASPQVSPPVPPPSDPSGTPYPIQP